MRRKDREITDIKEILEILEKAQVCSLGLCDGATPYVVPLNYGYDFAQGQLTLYFHGASQGRKLDLMRQNPQVAFAIHCDHQLVTAETTCGWGYGYRSLLGEGTLSPVTQPTDKAAALDRIMAHYSPEHQPHYQPEVLEKTTVLALKVNTFTAKGRKI